MKGMPCLATFLGKLHFLKLINSISQYLSKLFSHWKLHFYNMTRHKKSTINSLIWSFVTYILINIASAKWITKTITSFSQIHYPRWPLHASCCEISFLSLLSEPFLPRINGQSTVHFWIKKIKILVFSYHHMMHYEYDFFVFKAVHAEKVIWEYRIKI